MDSKAPLQTHGSKHIVDFAVQNPAIVHQQTIEMFLFVVGNYKAPEKLTYEYLWNNTFLQHWIVS